jgi:hypothetical protein
MTELPRAIHSKLMESVSDEDRQWFINNPSREYYFRDFVPYEDNGIAHGGNKVIIRSIKGIGRFKVLIEYVGPFTNEEITEEVAEFYFRTAMKIHSKSRKLLQWIDNQC